MYLREGAGINADGEGTNMCQATLKLGEFVRR
jgi:hypothetical protein